MNTQQINLNLVPKGPNPVVHANQFDVGREIAITLYDGNELYSFTGNETYTISGTKSNRKCFYYSDIVTVSNGILKFETTKLMTSMYGSTYCVLTVLVGGKVIGTTAFILQVQKNGIQDSDVVEEDNYDDIYDIIQQKIDELDFDYSLRSRDDGNGTVTLFLGGTTV